MFDYYKLDLKLLSPQLGTGTEVSIYHEHVLQKARKEIEKANKLGAKLTKNLEKYRGEDISENKEIEEMKGLLRAYCQLLGKQVDIPESIEEILTLGVAFQEALDEQSKTDESVKATVFQKDANGMPIISTHMILGNFKENLKIMVNGGDKSLVKSKVAVSEALALDIKFVEDFMVASNSILKGSQVDAEGLAPIGRGRWIADQNGRILLERPIKFDRMGKIETAIAMSEVLPKGTTMSCTMRVRKGSVLNQEAIEQLLTMGRSNGLGAWRGSGNMGSYCYKLELLPDFEEKMEDGWK